MPASRSCFADDVLPDQCRSGRTIVRSRARGAPEDGSTRTRSVFRKWAVHSASRQTRTQVTSVEENASCHRRRRSEHATESFVDFKREAHPASCRDGAGALSARGNRSRHSRSAALWLPGGCPSTLFAQMRPVARPVCVVQSARHWRRSCRRSWKVTSSPGCSPLTCFRTPRTSKPSSCWIDSRSVPLSDGGGAIDARVTPSSAEGCRLPAVADRFICAARCGLSIEWRCNSGCRVTSLFLGVVIDSCRIMGSTSSMNDLTDGGSRPVCWHPAIKSA